MPGTLVFDSSKVLAHATLDGNTLTEVDTGVVQKKLWADELGSVYDTGRLTEDNWPEAGLTTEFGTVTEAGGKIVLNSGGGGVWRAKCVKTIQSFSNYDLQVAWNNFVPVSQTWAGLGQYVDENNFFRLMRFVSGATTKISIFMKKGGAVKANNTQDTALNSFLLRVLRSNSGADYSFQYDIGSGFQELTAVAGEDIGTSPLYIMVWRLTGAAGDVVDFDYIRPGTTIVFWDNNPVVTYTEQDTGTPGATINMGSATGIFDATTLVNIKFGTSAYSGDLDLAGLQALGPQVTNNGKVAIRTVHKNGTTQSGYRNLNTPWTKAGVAGRQSIGRGIARGIGVGAR